MSTTLYLACPDHEATSEEVGQHLYDLEEVRGYFAERDRLVQAFKDLLYPVGENWRANAQDFFAEHEGCTLVIRDEYWEEHPITPEPEAGS